jgi:hypothetical protein
MFLSYEQVIADATVKTVVDLTVPANATMAELQADTQNIRYTMDNINDPTQAVGMVLLTTEPPRMFLIEDLLRIRFTRGANANANLNIHYAAGRDV